MFNSVRNRKSRGDRQLGKVSGHQINFLVQRLQISRSESRLAAIGAKSFSAATLKLLGLPPDESTVYLQRLRLRVFLEKFDETALLNETGEVNRSLNVTTLLDTTMESLKTIFRLVPTPPDFVSLHRTTIFR